MKVDIWMPLYVADYLASTSRLTTQQHGAYLLLIMDYWKNGPPPDDDAILCQITRLNQEDWEKNKQVLLGFFDVQDGKWTHARIEKEIAEAQTKREKQTARAKNAATKRWELNATSNATSNAQAIPKQCPTPTPTPTQKRPKTNTAPEGVSLEVWDSFLQQRQKTRAVVTETVIKTIQKEADLAGWPLERALSEIVARGWRGFKAEWVKDKQEDKLLTFAERDEQLKRKKWEEMTGRKWPEPGQPAERLLTL